MAFDIEAEKIHRSPPVGQKKRIERKTLYGYQLIVSKPGRLFLDASDLENRFERDLLVIIIEPLIIMNSR